jgi:hypothetical protein
MALPKPLPPLAYLHELLHYNPETGVLSWRISRGGVAKAGRQISTTLRGYVLVSINDEAYKAHRICYYMGTGIDPGQHEIDHIDRDRSNNRLANLRLATRSLNSCNRVSHGGRVRRPITITYPDGGTITAKHARTAAWLLQHPHQVICKWANKSTPHPITGITVTYTE